MITACYTNITQSGRVIVNTVVDDKQVKTSFVTFYDMNEIQIPKDRFELSDQQNDQFERVLNSIQGQLILNRLKNERVERIINLFLSYYKKSLGSYKIKENDPKTRKPLLTEFVDQIIKEPLMGKNSLSPITTGVSKKRIFDAFIQNKLINI